MAIGNKDLQQVRTFKYLRLTVFEQGKLEWKDWTSKWTLMLHQEKISEKGLNNKIAIYSSKFVSALTYRFESWLRSCNTSNQRANRKKQKVRLDYCFLVFEVYVLLSLHILQIQIKLLFNFLLLYGHLQKELKNRYAI